MKNLLVVGPKSTKQFQLLSELSDSYQIQIEEECPAKTDAETMLAWENVKKNQLDDLVKNSPSLKWVHTKSAGVEGILGEVLKTSSVTLTNAQGVFAESLAEFALMGMLYFAKDVNRMNENKAKKNWSTFEVECLKGAKLGILGFGGIGQQVASRALPFGMEVVAFRTKVKPDGEKQNGVMVYPISRFDEMISSFDYLSLSMPAVPETINFLNSDRLSKLKPTAVIINIGRGSSIDELAMTSVLEKSKIRGAVLDVFVSEPLSEASKLWELPNVFISPHTADRTATWLDETMEKFVENARLYASDKPLTNIVDKLRGY